MEKIVLVCQKKDARTDDLLKCLSYLFPECTLELRSKEQKTIYPERMDKFSEAYFE